MKTGRAANERISALFKLDLPFKQGNLCLLGLLRAPSGVYDQGEAADSYCISSGALPYTGFQIDPSPEDGTLVFRASWRSLFVLLVWIWSQSDLSGNLGFLCFLFYWTFLSSYMYGYFARMYVRAPHTYAWCPWRSKAGSLLFLNNQEMGKNYSPTQRQGI